MLVWQVMKMGQQQAQQQAAAQQQQQAAVETESSRAQLKRWQRHPRHPPRMSPPSCKN